MEGIIKSVSDSQEQIINWIKQLYCPDGIQLDPTYSKGVFYKHINKPKLKYDINPCFDDVTKADCTNLPIEDNAINTIMFDPPFIGGSIGKGKKGIIKERFGIYKDIPTLWEMYSKALREFYRILKTNGVLIFKCQDTIEHSKQYLSEYKIIKDALELGFYPKDKFILTAKSRLISPSQRKQQHSRKFHSYFLVFIKSEPKVSY